jgi:hypothetical protein
MYLNVVVVVVDVAIAVVVVVVDDALGFLVLRLLMIRRHAVAGVVRDPSHGVVARVLTATTTALLRPSTSRRKKEKKNKSTQSTPSNQKEEIIKTSKQARTTKALQNYKSLQKLGKKKCNGDNAQSKGGTHTPTLRLPLRSPDD